MPEYAGTAAEFYSVGVAEPDDDVTATHDQLVAALAGDPIVALAPAPAQDANTFVVTRTTAERLHVAHAQRPGRRRRPAHASAVRPNARLVRCASSASTTCTGCPSTASSASTPAGRSRCRRSREGHIDVGLLFTTDPILDDPDFVELADDRRLQPAENVTPLIRAELVDRWGAGITDVVDAASARLTTEAVRDLNREPSDDDADGHVGRRGLVGGLNDDGASAPMDPAIGDGGTGVPTSSVPPTVRRTPGRRRPTGAPPPLPRNIGRTGRAWIVGLVVLVAWMVVALFSAPLRRLTDRIDTAILRAVARLRTDWLVQAARGVDRVGHRLGDVLRRHRPDHRRRSAFRRWRHLFTFLGSVLVLEVLGSLLIAGVQAAAALRRHHRSVAGRVSRCPRRRRQSCRSPLSASSTCWSCPDARVDRQDPRHHRRSRSVVASRLYLAVDHPFDALVGVAFGVAIPLNAFRFFTPNEVVPVTLHGGKTAHLDVGGRRGEAVRQAFADQLGVEVVDIKPVGLAGSGGSTPLRVRLAGDPDTYVFGKLYAMNHVRSDRWYKTGRTILYGRLEDEVPFSIGPSPRAVRGLRPAADARLGHPDGDPARRRRVDARA